jgi:tetratricopeptide (TPR) repeat protein
MRAIGLEDSLSEAHAALAYAVLMLDRDWLAAESEFKRAINLNPECVTAHHRYAEYLLAVGQPAKAMMELERAREIEPLSLIINITLGWTYYAARRYEQAIEQYRRVVDLDPNYAVAHLCLAQTYMQEGRYDAAIEACHKARYLGGTVHVFRVLGYAYAISGDKARAEQVLEELNRLATDAYIPPYAVATIYAGLGERDEAFEWLDKALEQRDAELIWLKWDPLLDSLRSESRFRVLVDRVGLPP